MDETLEIGFHQLPHSPARGPEGGDHLPWALQTREGKAKTGAHELSTQSSCEFELNLSEIVHNP